MSTQRKALCAISLLVLALFLIVGAAIMSTHMALGVFLTTAALMLGPFAGLALLVYGVAGKRGVVTRSLYSLGGMLLLGAIGGIFAIADPIKATTPEALKALHAEGIRIVMLTGPMAGVGKSFLTVNLAVLLASSGKRVLMIDGEPVPFVLARIPQGDEIRGNLAAGGRGEARPINDDERRIAARAAALAARGQKEVLAMSEA